MTARAGVTAPGRSPALRYGLATSALVLVVSAVLALAAGTALASAQSRLQAAGERTLGTVSAVDGDGVGLLWTPAGGRERNDRVALAGTPPPVGTRTEVAYDPAAPGTPLIPGAALLADADRALSTLVLVATVATLVLAVGAWQLLTRRRAAARPARTVAVHRVRVRTGMISRSWLEVATTPQRWVPVHFDPVLVTLPAPATVRLLGDPLRDRLVAAEIGGTTLHPSGPVRDREPRGHRTDNPAGPDSAARERAVAIGGLRRRLLADLPLLVPAPLTALLWTHVDGGNAVTWVGATVLLAALGLWFGAVRGSDPS